MEEDNDLQEEIWSEYFRIKNTLMDNVFNFSNALGAAHMLIKRGKPFTSKPVMEQLFQCQREVGKILFLGIISKAFKEVSEPDKTRMKAISQGTWKTISDFDWCEERFEKWFSDSRFFDINIKKERMKAPHEWG